MNHTPHILASVLLCGLWLPIWALISFSYNAGFHCSQCGYTDAPNYLADPQSKGQQSQLSKIFHSILQWFLRLDNTKKALLIGSIVILFIFGAIAPTLQKKCILFYNEPCPNPSDSNQTVSNQQITRSQQPSSSEILADVKRSLQYQGKLTDRDYYSIYSLLNQIPQDAAEYQEAQQILNQYSKQIEIAKQNLFPAAKPTTADPMTEKTRIAKGGQVYKRIESRTGLPIMFNYRAKKMSLLIPTGDWNKLTREDQINLTYYAENLVQDIRKNPTPYAQKWINYYKRTEQIESGMEYDGLYESSYIDQVRNLCGICWDITLGQAKSDGFYDEQVPVTGTTVQSFREATRKE